MTVNFPYPMMRLDTAGTFDAIYQVAYAEREGSRMLIQSGNSEEIPL
jgi:hypothetical protein